MIGFGHNLRVVLHDDDGVPQLPKIFQDVNQTRGIAAVQTDGRFIQHVDAPTSREPKQVASWMRCDSPPDSVAESRSSVRYSRPDIVQEFAALPNFIENAFGDLRFFRTQLQVVERIVPRVRCSCARPARCCNRRDEPTTLPAEGARRGSRDTPCTRGSGS